MSDELAENVRAQRERQKRLAGCAQRAPSSFAAPHGSARAEDMAMLIRRLCRVVGKHDANNTVRAQALDYLHRKGLGGSPLKEAP